MSDMSESPDAIKGEMETPPPTATTPAGASSNGGSTTSSVPRRPPRKSTLTQQQKNQKRQRATQDQLVTLEMEFNKNPTPNAAVRERIAQEINMTERSVQIWFQNSRRRAKIKMMAKKSIEGIDDGADIPESMRHLLAMQAMEAGRPFPRQLMGRASAPLPQYGGGSMLMNGDPNATGKVVIHHFTCRSLSIGTWRRVGQNAMDLVIFYSPDKACITYYINNDSAGYKIEFPFAYIKSIQLEPGETAPPGNGSPPRPGGLVIDLNRPPNFFMDSSGSGGFYQCGDFTEDQQASQVLTHHLGGHPKVLNGQLAKLVSLESFQNRLSPFDANAMAASAPTSPSMGIVRPASQPHFARPHPPHVGMFQGEHFGINPHLQGARMNAGHMHPGHRRQRSKSVPIAIDFSMLHQGMPSFNIQPPSVALGPDGQPVFSPVPQATMPPQVGPNLQIDTSAGYGMDFRQVPVSATATSPSEFASPGFFPAHPHQVPMPAADFHGTQFNMPFLSPSPMGEANVPSSSVSPVLHLHHPDPVIANNSPPLHTIPRSASADMFHMGHDPAMLDEQHLLSEMYSKQNLNMPMASPGLDENGLMAMHDMSEYHTPRESLDIPMTPFGTIDPNALQAGDVKYTTSCLS
ncbi:hypothetical protein DV737_g3248, partial [Chaetothyriales sp. CBS 132003]